MIKEDFKNKKVLIFGLGLNNGGLGTAVFFARSGARVKVTDLKDAKTLNPSLKRLRRYKNISYTLGKHLEKDFDWAELIIKNQAIKPNSKYLKYAIKKKKEVDTDIGIFLKYVDRNQIIGITGTKGKTTTSYLMETVLKTCFKKVILAGNMGKSVLDTIASITHDTKIILELSSFQLESFDKYKISPKWAIITNIFEDHLNYYQSMKNYVNVKKAICRYQTPDDYLFLPKYDDVATSKVFLKNINSKIIFYSKEDLPQKFKPQLLGLHNLANFAAALSFGKTFGLNQDKILNRFSKFKGVQFRLELIKNYKGIKIYNDSTATNPGAAIKALESLQGSILIAGGVNKGLKYKEFAKAMEKYAKAVYFLDGDATILIKKSIGVKHKKIIKGVYKDFQTLLKALKPNVKKGDIILFSPGSASFNLFQNEFDRGTKFNLAAQKVFK